MVYLPLGTRSHGSQYRYGEGETADCPEPVWEDGVHDATIYPGLYSASGFDIMNALVRPPPFSDVNARLLAQPSGLELTLSQVRVYGRPDKKVDLGSVDLGCSIMVCDLMAKDTPVIYVSEAFEELTGYKSKDVLGKNCRFLQAPGGKVKKGSVREHVDKDTIKKMKKAVEKNEELQVEVVNFKKNGKRFVNLLTMIPIKWDGDEFLYSVAFQVEK